MDDIPISSSDIRKKAALGEDISGMVGAAVSAYIKKEGLYE
jgi:nicotinic acid mononucleotide adenylyltransferase